MMQESDPTQPIWVPEWVLVDKHGCRVGLTVDDHCYVVLLPDEEGRRKLVSWIPPIAVEKIVELGLEPLNVLPYLGDDPGMIDATP